MIKKRRMALALVMVGSTSMGIATAATSTSTNLISNEYLFPGQQLQTHACFYRLRMQGDGNLVTIGGGNAFWSSGTSGNVGGYAVMQGDGNFVIRNWNDVAVWSTGTSGHPGARLVQQSDVNLVVYTGSTPLWASGASGPDLGSTGCTMTVKTQVDGNTDRAGGDYANIIPSQARASWCGYFCSQDERCRAYTYVPKGVQDANPHCYLKDSVPVATAHTGLVSGKIIRILP